MVFIPVGLLAFSRTAIYYSCEFKQYSSDMLLTLVVIYLTFRAINEDLSKKSLITFTWASAGALWFSHTALITSLGCGIGMFILACTAMEHKNIHLKRLLIAGSILSINSLVCYLLVVKRSVITGMYDYHQPGFAPIPLIGSAWKDWHIELFKGFFSHPLGFGHSIALPALALVIGLALWAKKNRKMIWPLLFVLMTSYLMSLIKQYPLLTGEYDIYSRSTLFVLPIVVLLISSGVDAVARAAKYVPVYIAISAFFLFLPFNKARYAPPYWEQETRPLIDYIHDNMNKDDTVYVYTKCIPAFLYYTRNKDIKHLKGAYQDNPDDYAKEAEKLVESKHSWIIFSHCVEEQRTPFLEQMDTFAERKLEKKTNGAWLYLYEKRASDRKQFSL